MKEKLQNKQLPCVSVVLSPIYPCVVDSMSLIGKRVLINGLKARPELNGQSGLVKFFAEDRGRYAVVVNGEQIALKPENVTLASITLADESPPASAMVLHSSVDILMTIFNKVGVSPSLPCVCSWWRWTFNVWMREMVLLSPEFTIGGTTIGVARLTEFRARPNHEQQQGAYANRLNPVNTSFHFPNHIIALPSGELVLSESPKGQITVMSPDGAVVRTIGRKSANQSVKAGDLAFPTGLVVVPSHPGKASSEQMLLVSNSSRHRIDAFDLASGKACGYVGGPYRGESLDRLNYPEGLAYDHASQQVYVADSNNGRVVVYRLRRHGKLEPRFAFGQPHMQQPYSNIVHEEQLLTSDIDAHCVWVHTLTGTKLRAIGAGLLNVPRGITIACSLLVVVTANQLLVFTMAGQLRQKLKVPHGENMYGITTPASAEGGEVALRRVYVCDVELHCIHVLRCGVVQQPDPLGRRTRGLTEGAAAFVVANSTEEAPPAHVGKKVRLVRGDEERRVWVVDLTCPCSEVGMEVSMAAGDRNLAEVSPRHLEYIAEEMNQRPFVGGIKVNGQQIDLGPRTEDDFIVGDDPESIAAQILSHFQNAISSAQEQGVAPLTPEQREKSIEELLAEMQTSASQ